ncbi:MAG: carboxylesterase family protein [bacterium]|nr:carboxylesterase family protein [bacterium]
MKSSTVVVAVMCVVLCAQAQVMYAQRFFDEVFSEVDVTRDIKYGNALDYVGVSTDLVLDVYAPVGDTRPLRPLIIMVHGGGFTGGGKAGESMQTWGTDLAKRGFVAVSIEYRLGTTSKLEAKPMWEASLRAGQDVRASVRFMRSMAVTYGIDTSMIFLVGTSAGGFAIMQASVLQDDEIPAYVDPAVGTAEGTSGTPGVSSRVHALVVCWGAVTDTMNIDAGDPPIIAIHGTDDKTVPYLCGPSKFGFELCGAVPLTNRAQNLGIYNAMQLFEGAGHTLDGNAVLLDSCFTFFADELAGLVDDSATTSVNEYSNAPNTNNSNSVQGNGALLAVYPNPATSASIIVVSGASGYATLRIVDIMGRVVAQPFVGTVSGELRIPLPTLPAGSYYVVLHAEQGRTAYTHGLIVH